MNEYRLSSDSNQVTLKRLLEIVNTVPQMLRNFSSDEFSLRPSADKWSKKEIIGHLIDSATNNHHRFIRAQIDERPLIQYDQVAWNRSGHYQQMDNDQLISFWEQYNRYIHDLVSLMSREELASECLMSDGKAYSVGWLFDDYVRHLEHHLRQVFPPDSRFLSEE
jgi:hypothetical protein